MVKSRGVGGFLVVSSDLDRSSTVLLALAALHLSTGHSQLATAMLSPRCCANALLLVIASLWTGKSAKRSLAKLAKPGELGKYLLVATYLCHNIPVWHINYAPAGITA